jgi:hypothetical protein
MVKTLRDEMLTVAFIESFLWHLVMGSLEEIQKDSTRL